MFKKVLTRDQTTSHICLFLISLSFHLFYIRLLCWLRFVLVHRPHPDFSPQSAANSSPVRLNNLVLRVSQMGQSYCMDVLCSEKLQKFPRAGRELNPRPGGMAFSLRCEGLGEAREPPRAQNWKRCSLAGADLQEPSILHPGLLLAPLQSPCLGVE